MTKVNINLTLEGEDAMKVLRAILLKGQSNAPTQTTEIPVEENIKEDVPVKESLHNRGAGLRFKTPPWSDSELDYLALMLNDYYTEKKVTAFRQSDWETIEKEFTNLTGNVRTGKSMTVRVSMMRKREDERFFPEGMENRKTVFDKPSKSRRKKK